MSSSIAAPASWEPPTLSNNEAQAHTTIAQRAWGLPLHCGGTHWQASLRPVIETAWSTAPNDSFASIEWAGAQLQLQLPAIAIEQLMSALLDGAALPPIPEEMQAAALEAALSELLTKLERLGRGVPQIMTVSSGQPPAALPHAFTWRLDAKNAAMTGMLQTDSLGLLLIAGLASGRPLRDGPLASDDLQVKLHLDIGYASVSTEELQQLGLGDVLLMEHSLLGTERVLWLQAPGAGGLHVQLPVPSALAAAVDNTAEEDDAEDEDEYADEDEDEYADDEDEDEDEDDDEDDDDDDDDDEDEDADAAAAAAADANTHPTHSTNAVRNTAPFLTVVQSWSHAMPALENPMNAAASFDSIPVRLSFDLGEICLTLAELRVLQPGQTIRLGQPVASCVRIRANGALVGEGELVEIDGLLGISISQLFATSIKSAQ